VAIQTKTEFDPFETDPRNKVKRPKSRLKELLGHLTPGQPTVEKKIEETFDLIVAAVLDCYSEQAAKILCDYGFLAGGCFKSLLLNEPVNDWDVYFEDSEAADTLVQAIRANPHHIQGKVFACHLDFESCHALTLRICAPCELKVQLIYRYSGDPESVVEHFDFKHCQNYYSRSREKMRFDKATIYKRELVFNPKAIHPINSIKRAMKFKGQGWKFSDVQLFEIAKAISRLDLSDPATAEEHTEGLYGKKTSDRIKKQHLKDTTNC
jgi:hypothetical protein